MVILAPVIQILFVYQITSAGYLPWILLTGGIALALPSSMSIDIRRLEADELVEEIETIKPASRDETKELNQKPFGMRIALTQKARTGTNIGMTLFVVNNTDKARAVELKYVAPCFEPPTDSVPLKLKARTGSRIKFVVHLRSRGDYVVNARILDSQELVTGTYKKISVRTRSSIFRDPMMIVRILFGLASILIAAIAGVPEIIRLLS